MDEVEFIRKEAQNFYKRVVKPPHLSGVQGKIEDIKYRLFDYYTPERKSVFLHEIERIEKKELECHKAKYHKGKVNLDCSFDRNSEKLLFFLKQELESNQQFLPKESSKENESSQLTINLPKKRQGISLFVNNIAMKDVFVTYSWDGEAHEERVLSLTNHLRQNGFNAEVDKILRQGESALDFGKMMHQVMTDYRKVIVILSKGYKEKAESFSGGVGQEYSMLINDIRDNPNKYILASFEGHSPDVVPLGLKGRDVIDLSNSENLVFLYHKLEDIPYYKINEIGISKPELSPKPIPDLFSKALNKDNLEITALNSKTGDTFFQGYELRKVKNIFSIEIKNVSNKSIQGYSIEFTVPRNLIEDLSLFQVKGEKATITYHENVKIFPEQTIVFGGFQLQVTDQNISSAVNSIMVVKIYTEEGSYTQTFDLTDFFLIPDSIGNKVKLKEYLKS